MNQPTPQFDPIADARTQFPGTERWTYFDVGGRGLLSKEVRAAIDAQLDDHMFNGGNKDFMFQRTRETRELFARLIHAAPEDIAYTKNISDGLNMVAAAFDWKPGDNVIVCADLEHPNNLYPWLNQQRRGLAAPARTAMPTRECTSGTRLPVTTRPSTMHCRSRSSATITTSATSPRFRRLGI